MFKTCGTKESRQKKFWKGRCQSETISASINGRHEVASEGKLTQEERLDRTKAMQTYADADANA